MLHGLSSHDLSGGRHVTASAGGTFLVALAQAGKQERAAFGVGLEVALARAAGSDELTAPEWFKVMPIGPEISARDGRKWTLPNPQAVVDHFKANGADLPIDLNHASELLGPKGGDAPAQGWIKDVAVRADGIWVQADWNDAGRAALASKAYRYVSPAMLHTKDATRAVIGLSSVALVTQPALHIPALAGREPELLDNQDEDMTTALALAARLRDALGLGQDATDDQIVAAASTQVSLAAATKDPKQFVPAADLELALTRATTAEGKLSKIDTDAKAAAAAASVDTAIAEGKIAPASREHWLSVASATPDAFSLAMAAQPKVLTPPTDTAKKPGGDGVDENGLTPNQLSLCANLGIAPKDYAATLKEQAQ